MMQTNKYTTPTVERIDVALEEGFGNSVVLDDMYESEGSWE